ncbi:hypothetical protein K435DRAFT_581140, partial [Dendrothele bispora CBS 962.96]
MTKTFARATGQEFHIYYAEDYVVQKDPKRTRYLVGREALDAWKAEIKSDARDLSGRLGLVVGMPVIVVDNVAVELGISNGSRGTLVGIKYSTIGTRRYATSADVRLPNYFNANSGHGDPHVVMISTIVGPLTYTNSVTGKRC